MSDEWISTRRPPTSHYRGGVKMCLGTLARCLCFPGTVVPLEVRECFIVCRVGSQGRLWRSLGYRGTQCFIHGWRPPSSSGLPSRQQSLPNTAAHGQLISSITDAASDISGPGERVDLCISSLDSRQHMCLSRHTFNTRKGLIFPPGWNQYPRGHQTPTRPICCTSLLAGHQKRKMYP